MTILPETLDELERLANLASKGEWAFIEGLEYCHISCQDEYDQLVSAVAAWSGSEQEIHDARFIAAANPLTVKRLVEEIRTVNGSINN